MDRLSARIAIALGLFASALPACALRVSAVEPTQALVNREASPPRLLVYTRTTGWRHDSIPVAVDTLRALAAEAGMEVVHTEDPAMFTEEGLAAFRVVAFANTTGDILDATQQAAFERYVRAGGGWLGLHSAADTGYDWPWYGELAGAWFASHPPGLQSSRVVFEGGHGPALASTWRVTDELYNYRDNPRPRVSVIATVDEGDYAGGTMGADHPIAWCHERLGGRAWYTGLGHDIALYADPTFRAHLLRGLRYASGQAPGC